MAEFQEVMRQWKRRCEHCDAKEDARCYVHGYTCEAFNKMKDCTNFKFVEEDIMKWAEEHPEPVYPTWREWLIKLGIVSFDVDFRALLDTRPTTLANTVKAYINEEGSKPIPADIAEKLGLQPKEG